MSMSSGESYKRARNLFWIGFTVLWVAGWYGYCDYQRGLRVQEIRQANAAAAHECQGSSGWKSVRCSVSEALAASEGSADTDLFVKMVVVVLASPLMFLPARFVGRRYVALAQAREIQQENAAQARLERQQQEQSQERIARNEAEADSALRQISRGEIIHKLGAINGLTDLLQVETDEERRMN